MQTRRLTILWSAPYRGVESDCSNLFIGGPEEIRCLTTLWSAWSRRRPAVGGQHPTGVLNEILRISPVKNKEIHPDGCISLLVDPRRFELPTPTMRM